MKKIFGLLLVLLGFLFFPAMASAAPAPKALAGKVLIDVSGHGEAWYVNPRSLMKVYLGRPEQALERLKNRAVFVSYDNIARIGETPDTVTDAEYTGQQSGYVMSPSDVIGASWYVDPATKLRRRLATANDAWEIMKQGTPANAKTLASIDTEPQDEPVITTVTVKEVTSATTLTLTNGKTVRLLSVDVPPNPELQAKAIARLTELTKGKTVTLESDARKNDPDGSQLRFVSVGGVNLNNELVRSGFAFAVPESPNFKYAEMLIVAFTDAERHKNGFWKQ